MSLDNIDLTFHIENKNIQNVKFFVIKGKQYPVDFDLLKKNSQYFYRNRKQFAQVNTINLLNSTDESLIDIPEGTIQAFAASCCNQPCKIGLSDVIPLQYLSYKFEFIELIKITNKFIEEHWNNLVLPSILFKIKIQPNNQRKSDIDNIPPSFINTEKEEEIISLHLNEYIQNPEMLLLPISNLDRIFHHFYCSQKVHKISNEMIEFLFKYLDKHGIDASILFSYIDFGEQSIDVMNRLIHNYSEKFDFNMINSTLLKTTTQLTSEVAKMKEDFSIMFSQMTQKFNEQQEELNKIRKIENKKAKIREELFEQEMNKMKEKEDEREKIFQNELNKMKEEEKKRKSIFEEELKKLRQNK